MPSPTKRTVPTAMIVIAVVAVLLFVVAPLVLGLTSGNGRGCEGTVTTDSGCFR
jgi:hypothetical protein